MASKVVDLAMDKISKKYPAFCPDSGKKVVSSMKDAFKTYKQNKKGQGEGNSEGGPESDALLNVPGTSQGTPVTVTGENEVKSNRDSLYDCSDEFYDASPAVPNGNGLNSQANGIPIDGDTIDASYRPLSDNPSLVTIEGADNEKNPLVDPSQHPLSGHPKPPDTPNISQYLQKKSMAQGMMDLALLSANTNQLRYILDSRDENSYFGVSLTLIISSLVMQIVVGLMLVWNSQYNVQRKSGFASADRINNLSVFGVFLITLINVFVSTFGNVTGSGSTSSTTTPVLNSTTVAGLAESTTLASIVESSSVADVPIN